MGSAAGQPGQTRLTGLWLHGASCTGPDSALAEPTAQLHAASAVDMVVHPMLRRQQSRSDSKDQELVSSRGHEREYHCPVYGGSKHVQGGAAQRQLLLEIPLQLPADCRPDTLQLHGVCLTCQPSV